MKYHYYILCLIFFKCVVIYSKNHTTYTFNPRLSQIKLLTLPQNTLFLGTSHRNSTKNSSRHKLGTHSTHKVVDEEVQTEDNKQNNDKESPDYAVKYEDTNNNPEETREEDKPEITEQTESNDQAPQENGFLDQTHENQHGEQRDTYQDEQNHDHNQSNQDYDQNWQTNDNPGEEPETNKTSQLDENKQIVDDIAKEEQMKDMHNGAGEMMDSAKVAKEKADELLKQYKEGTFSSDTNRQTLPKDEAGNIIISNTTTTPVTKEEEKVDRLKSIRDATYSLFERAKHKNLPVPDPGDLSTPEQVYSALNSLEYIIDGYRYTKIDLNEERSQEEKNADESTKPSSMAEEQNNETQTSMDSDSNETNASNDTDEETFNPDRYLQVQDDEDSDDFNDEEDEDKNEDYDEEREDEFNKQESEEEYRDSSEEKKPEKLSPHQAMENLREMLKKLSSVLETVVRDNTGVTNVIMREDVKKQ